MSQYSVQSERTLPLIAIGRVKRTYSPAGTQEELGASNDAQFQPVRLADDFAGWAGRSMAANGFGDAVVGTVQQVDRGVMPGSFASGAAINASLYEITTAIVASTGAVVRRLFAAWQRRQDQQATVDALRALDARTLRDLGIDASELRSVAVELSGISDPTRAHALMSLRNLAV
jgi:uncharacterized protein YjiS (DUF1127 family)